MEFRAVHIFEYSESGGAIFTQGGYSVGDAAVGRLCGAGTWPGWTGDCYQAEMAVRDRSALIRFNPDTARGVVLRLSNILRRLLRKHETFVPLKEELQFIDDYLDIEVARFGKDNLEIIKEIDDETLEAFVPSMLLQPMVENCLKHGLAPKIEGGRIRLHAEQHNGRLRVEIEDNGVGISEERMPHVYVEGIGLSNVRERLRVLYGTDFRLEIESRPGEGTVIRIEVPELVPAMPETARTL